MNKGYKPPKTRMVLYELEYDRDVGCSSETTVQRLLAAVSPLYNVKNGYCWFQIEPGQKARVVRSKIFMVFTLAGAQPRWLSTDNPHSALKNCK